MIKISHIMYSKKAIGIALNKLSNRGLNTVEITIRNKEGELMYPQRLQLDKEELMGRYEVEIINKNNLLGFWIPIDDFPLYY